MKYLPVKLYLTHEKKNQTNPREKKWWRVKTEKSVRENNVLYLKTPKSQKNWFHGHFWVSRGKKTLTISDADGQRIASSNTP